MNVSAPFIVRPIATTLMMIGLTLLGLVAYFLLPIAGVPQVDVPTVRVSASLPGANAETMATSVAAPLESQLALISGVTAISSTSSLGQTQIRSNSISGAASRAPPRTSRPQSAPPAACCRKICPIPRPMRRSTRPTRC
jgi:AcrB/AcrD/AcrF family